MSRSRPSAFIQLQPPISEIDLTKMNTISLSHRLRGNQHAKLLGRAERQREPLEQHSISSRFCPTYFRNFRRKCIGFPLALLPVLVLVCSLQIKTLSRLVSWERNIGDSVRGASTVLCERWSTSDAINRTLQPFDLWYTHHPNWVIINETESMFCLAEVDQTSQTHPHVRNITLFYANQFHSPCNIVHKRTMWQSGWSADFWNMQAGLIHALYYHVPFFIERFEGLPWHYTANKDDQSNLTCPAGDTTCYFLPYHGCNSVWNISTHASMLPLGQNVEILGDDVELHIEESDVVDDWGWTAYLFMTRKQLWLRRAVFDCKEHFRQSNNIETGADCSVIHVRRADVVLHDESSRRYFHVADYVKMIPQDRLNNINHFILLLTDDLNAIDEANQFFPTLKWKYLDRPRFRGSSGGWENQTPSRNPANEVIFMLTEFELTMGCSVFVHGQSGFSNIIHRHVSNY